jgi:pyridoxine kinase
MAKVLSVSSQVVYGHVGNSTAAFVLQRMGHEVLSLPTVLLSNRPGYGAIAGEPVSPAKLDAMLGAVWSNGWLAGVDAILTGYIPTAEHALLCERWIKALDQNALYVCDPIIGDEPGGVYIREEAARAIREKLAPLADVLTPNLFELGWLTGRTVADAAGAVEAARSLWKPDVIVTSAPAPAPAPDMLANMLVEELSAAACVCPREIVNAHGTGDFFAAIFLAHRLNGLSSRAALQAASAAMSLVLSASKGRGELALVETQAEWAKQPPAMAPFTPLPGCAVAP